MGYNSPFNEFEREHKSNGHADVYGPLNWRDNIVVRRSSKKISGKIVIFGIDVITLAALMKILPLLDSVMQVIAAGVGIIYLAARSGLLIAKFIVYVVRYRLEIKKFFRGFKDHFNER